MKLNNRNVGFSIILKNKLHLIMIRNEYQNKGYGTIFLSYIENRLFMEYDSIELQSFVGNSIANQFYKKNGWKKLNKVNNGIEVYRYKKSK
jgi:ribosomal protein S18 acetylase RimI-like enzyme